MRVICQRIKFSCQNQPHTPTNKRRQTNAYRLQLQHRIRVCSTKTRPESRKPVITLPILLKFEKFKKVRKKTYYFSWTSSLNYKWHHCLRQHRFSEMQSLGKNFGLFKGVHVKSKQRFRVYWSTPFIHQQKPDTNFNLTTNPHRHPLSIFRLTTQSA